MTNQQTEQRAYYERTARDYDQMHLNEPEHEFALAQLLGLVRYFRYQSLLDIGAGTGRVLRHAKSELPEVKIAGIEPVEGLREIGYSQGLSRTELIEGNALDLQYEDNSWDIVCAFGILHHIPEPARAIAEMCRIARHGVFFSDLNNYGCGPAPQRFFSQALRIFHLWRPFQFLKNGGTYEKFSEGDGIHYSYSLFDNINDIRQKFNQIHLTNTKGFSSNIFKGCSHVSIFAVADDETLTKRREEIGR